MQQVKLFKSVESELEDLQKSINDWIKSSGAKVISITGNIAPQTHVGSGMNTFASSDILVVVLYEA
ncbi:hypothetical protein SH139x_000363 [Planctomycetaceae bacterium SH139]